MGVISFRSNKIRMATYSLVLGAVFYLVLWFIINYFRYPKWLFEPFGLGEWIGPYWWVILANFGLGYKMGKTPAERIILCVIGVICSIGITYVLLVVDFIVNPIPF